MSTFPGIICKGCRKDDQLYQDSHGIFCSRCGPSVPMTRGWIMGEGALQLYVDHKASVRDIRSETCIEESESARIHSQNP